MQKSSHPNGTAGSRMFSVDEVANHFGVSTKTIRRQISAGALIAHRIGRSLRVSEDDLQRYRALRRG